VAYYFLWSVVETHASRIAGLEPLDQALAVDCLHAVGNVGVEALGYRSKEGERRELVEENSTYWAVESAAVVKDKEHLGLKVA
jgi:hypothetical protein